MSIDTVKNVYNSMGGQAGSRWASKIVRNYNRYYNFGHIFFIFDVSVMGCVLMKSW